MKKKWIRKFIGDKDFYRMVLMVAVPIMIQNGITNFVGLLDNIMVGRVGTEQMSGVAIVNQLMMVFNISIFGAISGAGIFGAQFYGGGDHKGVRDTFRFKVYASLLILLLGLPPFCVDQFYTSTLRECGETMLPMKSGIAAVLVNLVLNTILIFGLRRIYIGEKRCLDQ